MLKIDSIAKVGLLFSLALPTFSNAGTYYNCANATGCKPVQLKKSTKKYTKTKYPIVLAHGMSGWNRAINLVDYFHGIPQTLMKNGTENVFATKVSSFNSGEHRGEQLLQQVKTIAAITGKQKVNLFGHSQGGIDSRYVAAVAPEYVASVTAVASPGLGSKMADWVVSEVEKNTSNGFVKTSDLPKGVKVAFKLASSLGTVFDVASNVPLKRLNEQDSWVAIKSLSSKSMSEFNKKYSAALPKNYCDSPSSEYKINGVAYYSFSGVTQITSYFDPTDYALALTAKTFGDEENDGLVSTCSSRLGYVLRDDYIMNHLDSANLMLGLVSFKEVNPKTVYRAHVNRLKRLEGL